MSAGVLAVRVMLSRAAVAPLKQGEQTLFSALGACGFIAALQLGGFRSAFGDFRHALRRFRSALGGFHPALSALGFLAALLFGGFPLSLQPHGRDYHSDSLQYQKCQKPHARAYGYGLGDFGGWRTQRGVEPDDAVTIKPAIKQNRRDRNGNGDRAESGNQTQDDVDSSGALVAVGGFPPSFFPHV